MSTTRTYRDRQYPFTTCLDGLLTTISPIEVRFEDVDRVVDHGHGLIVVMRDGTLWAVTERRWLDLVFMGDTQVWPDEHRVELPGGTDRPLPAAPLG